MNTRNESIETLNEIKDMMERSSKFISLSGLSGIAAGVCVLIGSIFIHSVIQTYRDEPYSFFDFVNHLLLITFSTFVCALASALFFTYRRCKKTGVPIWGMASRRMMFNIGIPFVAGGFIALQVMLMGYIYLFAPISLVVYGIALFCGSEQSTNEIRYFAYIEMVWGAIAFYFLNNSLFFGAVGFGVFHIIYGFIMWFRYERNKAA